MSSVREYSYKINGLALADDAIIEQIHDDFREVSGVIGINVKKEEEIIEYVLDQWSSDYDAFSKLSEICEKYNLELMFDDDEVIENEISNEEFTPSNEEEIKDEPVETKNKMTKGDFIEKIGILALSVCFILVGFLLNSKPNIQPWIFMIGFTLASYNILYSSIVKLTEKEYLFEEILTFAGALILTYQGNIVISAVIMLLYSILNLVVSVAKHKVAVKKDALKVKIALANDKKEKETLLKRLEFVENNENVCSKSTLNLKRKRLQISLIMVGIALLAVFVPPLFTIKTYWYSITSKWLYLGVCVLLLNGFSETIFSISNAETNAVYYAIDNDIEINSIDAFLNLSNAQKVCFDKSGVLTKNCKIESVEGSDEVVLLALSALNTLDNHIANAVKEYATDLNALEVSDLDVSSHIGVSCTVNGSKILVGSRKFLKEHSVEVEEYKDGVSRLFVAVGGKCIGNLVLSAEIYNDSYGAIAELKHDLGLKTEILSSDDGSVVTNLKKQIKADHAIAGASPKFKAEKVKKENAVYVGDELNDEMTLSLVDNAITFGKNGKIAITSKSIRKVPLLLKLAKRTVNTVKSNKKLAIITKIVLFAIAVVLRRFTAIDFIWWIFAIDVLVRLGIVLKSMFNSSEVA